MPRSAPMVGVSGEDSHEHPRVPRWLRRFVRPRSAETLPILLHRRRIYVLPTPYGLFFAVLLATMTLGGLNYNNNPALILCFLMLSLMLSALLRGYLNLSGLRLESLTAAPVHAGELQQLRLRFGTNSRRLHDGLVLERNGRKTGFSVQDGTALVVELATATQRRGWMASGRFKLYSRQPLGLFEVWSWLHPDTRTLVWPALEKDPPAPPGVGGRNRPRPQRGSSDEPIALRDYRSGDPMRQVAWKHSARMDRLLVREYEQPDGSEQLFSWDALAPMPSEARARRLARWLADAERQGHATTLVMPDASIGPSQGPAHLHACFRALALAP